MSRTLMAVFAHPDDEAFGVGGTLARCAAEGLDVHLVCATRGESGKITDPGIPADADVGTLREAELRDACAALGIHPPIFLDYVDSGRYERVRFDEPRALRNVDPLGVAADVRAQIARVQPEVMIAFDPHGIYGHVDHVVMHRAATAAFWSAGAVTDAPPKRLFQTVMTAARLRTMQDARPGGPLAELDADVYGVGEGDLALVVNVAAQREKKRAAIRAHRSQVGPRSSFAAREAGDPDPWERMGDEETFTLGGLRGAFPAPPLAHPFEGLDD